MTVKDNLRVWLVNRYEMKTISFISLKGGVGKTSSAISIAGILAERSYSVLVIDLDPTASSSFWLNTPSNGLELLDVLNGTRKLAGIVQITSIPNLSVIPSGTLLSKLEVKVVNTTNITLLKELLHSISSMYEYILIDCQPGLGVLTRLSLVAADVVISPVPATAMALISIPILLNELQKLKNVLKEKLEIALICSRYNTQTKHSHAILEQLRNRFGHLLLQTVIRESVRLQESLAYQQPITLFASSSRPAVDYRSATSEICNRFKEL